MFSPGTVSNRELILTGLASTSLWVHVGAMPILRRLLPGGQDLDALRTPPVPGTPVGSGRAQSNADPPSRLDV